MSDQHIYSARVTDAVSSILSEIVAVTDLISKCKNINDLNIQTMRLVELSKVLADLVAADISFPKTIDPY
jgi:hypothetical protein